MALPTFNSFAFNDSNFITERIIFKGYADRAVIRGQVNRREGIKLIGTEFGEKSIKLSGQVLASSATALQTLLDGMKQALTYEEGDLVIENGRTFKATVADVGIPDEHYNQTKAPWEVTFICTDPYAEGSSLSVVQPVTSGVFTFSGMVNISGSMFARPSIVYTPGTPVAGNTNIRTLSIYHVPTGQTVTISGFNNSSGLLYSQTVTMNYDTFLSLQGTADIDNSGAFSRWEPGVNQYTISVSGRWPGGSVQLSYAPRYL